MDKVITKKDTMLFNQSWINQTEKILVLSGERK